MSSKAWTAFLLCSVTINVMAQNEMFSNAFEEFSRSRIWAYEEISVDWKMSGHLQADFNEGLNLLMEGSASQAEAAFTEVIKKDPAMWQAWYFRAAAGKLLRKFWVAESDIRRALKLNGNSYEAQVELGKILHLQGDNGESERAISRAIRMNRSKPAAYYLKGDINLFQGQPRLAANNYKECLAADSLFHDARIMLALLDLIARKDEVAALRHMEKILEYDSLQRTALLFRSIFTLEKNKEQSVRDLTSLIKVSPNNMLAYYIRGFCFSELGNYRRAFSDFNRVIKGTETSDNNFQGRQTSLDKKIDLQNAGAYTVTRVYGLPEEDALKLQEAYCHIITRNFDKGITVITRTYNYLKEPLALYLNAVAHEHKGDHHTALKFYNQALAIDNEIADAHKKRAIYAQELKQWEHSIKDLTEVLRINPDAFVIYRIRGVSYFHNNEFEKSIADFNRYLAKDTLNKEVMEFRGVAYWKNNQRLLAYADLAFAGKGHLLVLKEAVRLVDSVLIKRDTATALACLRLMTEGMPVFTEGWVRRFKIEMSLDDWNPIDTNISQALRNIRTDAAKSDHSFLLTAFAMNLSRQDVKQEALKKFDEAIKFDKMNALAYLERGKLQLEMGKVSRAESDFKQALSLGDKNAETLLTTLQK